MGREEGASEEGRTVTEAMAYGRVTLIEAAALGLDRAAAGELALVRLAQKVEAVRRLAHVDAEVVWNTQPSLLPADNGVPIREAVADVSIRLPDGTLQPLKLDFDWSDE